MCPTVSKLEQNYNYTRALVWKIAKGPSMVQNCIPFTQGCIVPSSDRNGRMVLELIERLYIWVKWDNYLSFERDLPFGQTTFIYLKKALFLVWLKLTFIVALERKYFWNVSIISPWKTSESMLPSRWLSVRAFGWYKSEKKIDNDDGHLSFKIHLILRHSPPLNEDLRPPEL